MRMTLPRWVEDVLIRRKAKFHEVNLDRYEVRIARTAAEYEDAFRLVYVSYASLGIETLRAFDLRMTEQHVLREATVLVVYEGSRLVGTLSVTLDSPAGLPLDRDYRSELDGLRHRGAKVAEIGSYAVVERCRRTGVAQLLGLASFRVGSSLLGASDFVVGIHPRAKAYYRSMWGFHGIGANRDHAALHAPVTAMHVTNEGVREHIARSFRRPLQGGALPIAYLNETAGLPGMPFPTDVPLSELTRWKMPREVFRQLFVDGADRLHKLRPETAELLRLQRSDQTLLRVQTVRSLERRAS